MTLEITKTTGNSRKKINLLSITITKTAPRNAANTTGITMKVIGQQHTIIGLNTGMTENATIMIAGIITIVMNIMPTTMNFT